MMATWTVQQPNLPHAARLAQACGIHPVTAQLLLNRGIDSLAEAQRFFAPGLDRLQPPDVLPDLPAAVARLRRAIAEGEPILVFGDSDVDGLTANVIVYEVLRELGATVRSKCSNRISDGYGLPAAHVRQIARSGTKVLVLVDCGTNQAEELRALTEHGIDTIVLDHHVPVKSWAQPYALVNPHRTQGPGRELCSAGLAIKLAQALFDEAIPDRLTAFLDLAALGTLADYAPLIGDSRILVSEGLPRLAATQRPGLRRLCEATGMTAPEPEQVTRRLVPRLNASGRLGDPTAVWHLLRRELDGRWRGWLLATEAAHAQTKELHRRITAQAQEQVNRLHFRDQHVVVVSGTDWHQGLMGPLAARLAERYGRPAIALALDSRQGIGSGRSVPLFNLLQTLTQCEPLLVEFGGHAQACGLRLRARDVASFRSLVNLRAREQLGAGAFVRRRLLDLAMPLADVEPRWIQETERFAPFGPGNARPAVSIRQVTFEVRSPRVAWASDGTRRVLARGGFSGIVPGWPYDVAAGAEVAEGTVTLTVNDVKPSVEPSELVRTADSSYTPGRA